MSRRDFIIRTSVVAGVTVVFPGCADDRQAVDVSPPLSQGSGDEALPMLQGSFRVNGVARTAAFDSRVTLLDLLRNGFGLTGAKKGCDHAQCGACTVMIDGKRINSCLSLAAQNRNKEITTIEGLAQGESLHPMQQAFLEQDAFQCGFCTPGQIMSAVALMNEPCGASEDEIRECMSGNLCRCGAYRNILAAIERVKAQETRHAAV